MNYAEYLKAQGASDEDIKVLDTAVARKAFDKMMKDADEAKAAAARAEKEKSDYEAKVNDWHQNTIVPEYERMKNEALAAKANEAKARAVIEAAQKEGLLDVADKLGWKKDDKPADKGNDNPGFDASKYMTREEILHIAQQEGRAIATMGKLIQEHERLFPGQAAVDWTSIYESATQKKRSVEQEWMERFNVQAAREARTKAEQEARDKKIRDEAYAAAQSEMASKYGNPETRPLAPSRSPLAPRAETGREKQPWDQGDRANDRVKRATESVIKQSMTN